MGTGSTLLTDQHWDQKDEETRCTLNNHILTCLLVPLTLATNLVGEAVVLMFEGLAVLAYWDSLNQLSLGIEDQ